MAHPVAGGDLGLWSINPGVVGPLGLAAAIYVRGWLGLRGRAPHRVGAGRLAAFLSGLVVVAGALQSPLHGLGAFLLQAHMVQHLLLMMVAPPLIWLGTPTLPILHGLPRPVVTGGIGPLLTWPPLARLARVLAHPAVTWIAFVGSAFAWHVPAIYERVLAQEAWHYAQHACFLGTALAFWWPVGQPWAGQPGSARWALVCYLVLADLANTALSAWLVFTDRVVYPTYEVVPRLWGTSALDDQAAAGAIMWVLGSAAFLVPAALLVVEMLSPRARAAVHPGQGGGG